MSLQEFFHHFRLIDEDSRLPKYRQIADNILLLIQRGELAQDFPLPSLNDMADEYFVSRDTIAKSYNLLKDCGAIVGRHGKGFFVADYASSVASQRERSRKSEAVQVSPESY